MPDILSSRLQVPTELENAGNSVRTISNGLAMELNDLRAKLAPLQESWTGQAYTYFTGLEQQWNLASVGLWGDGTATNVGLLPFIAHALDKVYENYSNAEASNVKTWQR
ncbi:WXG100 family type VII secretion target [Actinoplanes sp. NPDC051346]|uniref:WXG100 family type VII secretion target n=1 Tax=Actinoplanes sp. NPDC051346 TaxID=3155048 RepID=UPI00343A78C6